MTTRLAAGSDSTIWVGAAEPTLALHHRPGGCRIGRPGEGNARRSPVGEYVADVHYVDAANPPAAIAMEVKVLFRPEYLIEIEPLALVKDGRP